MSGSNYLYRFISTSWSRLPKKEKDRYGELWKGYEQIFAELYQRFYELDQAVNINNIPVYTASRWNKYTFDETNEISAPATFTSYQDLSNGIDLTDKYMISIAINNADSLEIDCRGIDVQCTTINEILFAINQAVGYSFATGVFENTLIQLQTLVKGPTAKIEILAPSNSALDATELVLGVVDTELPLAIPKFPFKYDLSNLKARKIPSMQSSIRTESLDYYIIEDMDFFVNWKYEYLEFREEPPSVLWAKTTYIEEQSTFYNFGHMIGYQDTSLSAEDYLRNVQGLWFAYWQGPRPEFIKRALALLFGLPVALDDGQVLAINSGIMEILHMDGQVKGYHLPSQLQWVLGVGDYVERFEVLTTGIDIYDKASLPGFVQTEIGRSAISPFALPEATLGSDPDTDESKALQMLEEHTFLPQINVNAFVKPNINLATIFNFLKGIKPLHKSFYFQVIVAIFNEEIALEDKIALDIDLDITPNLEINQTNWSPEEDRESYETLDNEALDLDSDTLIFSERGSMSFKDITGPLVQYDVVFD